MQIIRGGGGGTPPCPPYSYGPETQIMEDDNTLDLVVSLGSCAFMFNTYIISDCYMMYSMHSFTNCFRIVQTQMSS